jgi:hypothetical protein
LKNCGSNNLRVSGCPTTAPNECGGGRSRQHDLDRLLPGAYGTCRIDESPATGQKPNWGDVCLPIATVEPAHFPEETFTYIDIGSVDSSTNRIASPKTLLGREAPSRARQSVAQGDILFSTVRTYLRKIAKIDEVYHNPLASTGFVVIRPAAGISPDFLLYQVLSPKFMEAVQALQTGTVILQSAPRMCLTR